MQKPSSSPSTWFSNVLYRPLLSTSAVPFDVRSVGYARLHPHHNEGLRIIDFAQLIWTIHGEGDIHRHSEEYRVLPNTVVIYLP